MIMKWALKFSVGEIPLSYISDEMIAKVMDLGKWYSFDLDACYLEDGKCYVEIRMLSLSPYVHIFTLDTMLVCLRAEIRKVLGCDVSPTELDTAHRWLHDFRMFGDGCTEYA